MVQFSISLFFFFVHPRNVITLRIFRRFIYERFVCSDQSLCLTDIGRTAADDSINFWLSIPSSILLLFNRIYAEIRVSKLKVSRQLEIIIEDGFKGIIGYLRGWTYLFVDSWSISKSISLMKLLSGLKIVRSNEFSIIHSMYLLLINQRFFKKCNLRIRYVPILILSFYSFFPILNVLYVHV